MGKRYHDYIMQQQRLELEKDSELSKARKPGFLFALSFRLLSSFDYVAILRPLLLIPVWTMLFLGYYKGIDKEFASHISLPLIGDLPVVLRPHSEILITFLLYSFLMGAIYILNQLSDSVTDAINGKLYLIAKGCVKKSVLKVQIVILLLISVVMAFLLFPLTYSGLVLFSIVLGILYSVPPIRLKGKPVLDLFANAFGFGVLAFAVGWTSKTDLSMRLIFDCLPYFICVSAAFINTTIPDIEGDTRNGDTTTGAVLGIRRSCILSTILVGMVPLISWFNKDFIALTASILSLPFFIYMTISNRDERSPDISSITLATKVSLLVLSLLVAVIIPFYFILLIFTILLMKLYHQMRFGISYP